MDKSQDSNCGNKQGEDQLDSICRGMQGSEDSIKDTLDSIPTPVLLVGIADDKVMYANSAVQDVFGYKHKRLVNREYSCLVPRIADRRKLKKRARGNGCIRDLKMAGRCRDGRDLWLSVSQQRVVCGATEMMLLVLKDITEEKLEEQRNAQQHSDLEKLLAISDQDRELIACDIHDGVIQDMTGALMLVEATRRKILKGGSDGTEDLKIIAEILRNGVAEARRLIDGVRPPDLEELGLIGALQRLIDRTTATKGIEVEFLHEVSDQHLSPRVEMTVYRIAQECLNNVWRHSKSRKARIQLTQKGNALQLEAKDWGVGFNPENIDDTRFGLSGVRQRAEMLGGSVAIRTSPGSGCTVRVALPMAEASQPDLVSQ